MGKETVILEGKIKNIALLVPDNVLGTTKKLWSSDKCQGGMATFTRFEAN